ncbi:MAG: hypothetical protein JXJ19_03400 [Elusimicrobia bacterium]|nr:hypothetical protein [Elusimicrobiota bacterium]
MDLKKKLELKKIYLYRRFYSFFERPSGYEPYDFGIYEEALSGMNGSGKYNFIGMEHVREKRDDRINVILRHDIDRMEDVGMLETFLEYELERRMFSSSYIRVDGEKYSPADILEIVRKYAGKGHEFGLHSSCYTHDDCMGRFEWEAGEFLRVFGFRPGSFTQHGMGSRFIERRQEFNGRLDEAKKRTGISMTDCCMSDVLYHFKVTDANYDYKRKARFLGSYFRSFPYVPYSRGKCYLVLTHPGYWKKQRNAGR